MNRFRKVLFALFALTILACCHTNSGSSHALGYGLNPVNSASAATNQKIGAWCIDPANTSGCASDINSGTSCSCANGNGPLSTWKQLVFLWGTFSPTLAQNTVITFNSSQANNTDPVIFEPIIQNGAQVSIVGTPTVVTSAFSISGTTAKSRAVGTNSLLITTLGATGAVGQLLTNATHASTAWAYKSLGANSFDITQPFLTVAIPALSSPTEVDTWANTDAVTLSTVPNVNIVTVKPKLANNPAQANPLTLYRLNIYDPDGTGQNPCFLYDGVQLQEVSASRIVVNNVSESLNGSNTGVIETNVFLNGGISAISSQPVVYYGGAITSSAITAQAFGNAQFDADFIFGAPFTFYPTLSLLGSVYLDNNMTVSGDVLQLASGSFSSIIYGGGSNTINVVGVSKMVNTAGTFVAKFTAPGLVTGIKLNGTNTGSSSTTAGVLSPGITLTPAHLDAAQGAAGCGGNCFNQAGGSVSTTL